MAVRFDKVVYLRLPGAVVAELKERANADDRSLGSYLRRLICSAATPTSTQQPEGKQA